MDPNTTMADSSDKFTLASDPAPDEGERGLQECTRAKVKGGISAYEGGRLGQTTTCTSTAPRCPQARSCDRPA
eukprot:2417092-Pyramimonas_sp.AAC.1